MAKAEKILKIVASSKAMTENSDPEDMMSFGCNDCVKIVFISWAAVARHIEKGQSTGTMR